MRFSRLTRFFLAGSFLAATGAPAFALDTEDLMAKLKALTEEQSQMTFTYDSAKEGPDGDVTISGVVFAPTGDMADQLDDFEQKAPITLELENIQENADGSYLIGKSISRDASFEMDDVAFDIASMTETNVHIPATADMAIMSGWGYGETTEINNISVTFEGQKIVTIERATAQQSFNDARTQATYQGDITGFAVDLTQVDDIEPETRARLEELGLMQTVSTFTISGDWDLESGDMNVNTYSLATENVGTLDFSVQMTGMTMEVMETLREMSETAQAEPAEDMPAEESPYQDELMQLGQSIGINGLSIGFTDDGITDRVLKSIADEKNMTPDALIADLKAQMTASLGQLEMPELSATLSTAVDAYLADPQNFTVSIKPQMQMPVLAVFMAGAAAPKAIPQLLNLEIKANQ